MTVLLIKVGHVEKIVMGGFVYLLFSVARRTDSRFFVRFPLFRLHVETATSDGFGDAAFTVTVWTVAFHAATASEGTMATRASMMSSGTVWGFSQTPM
jgi:hypothetical protein